jgi:bifunctional enzyme CysN/CysC
MAQSVSEQLKVVIVGHVDHGKSTLVGRIIHDTGSLPEGKLDQLKRIAEARGVPFEWANLMDSLQSERDQNITIDTTQIWFQTKRRQYVLIDAPGHKEFLKNMVTGAAGAEAALLLLDASEGVQEQSRRHGYLLHLLGIKQVAVVVNKMDLLDYSQERFERLTKEYQRFLETVGIKPRFFVPISAKAGENIGTRSEKMPWWSGPTVIEALDNFIASAPLLDKPLRFVVQDVYRFDHRRILAGRIEAGTLNVGDKVLFSPGNKVSTVKTIELWSSPLVTSAAVGQSVGITLSEQIFVERGAVGSLESAPPFELSTFRARIFWLGKKPFLKGRAYKLKLATQEIDCEIREIHQIVDASTLESITHSDGAYVGRHEVAELTLHARTPIAFDLNTDIAPLGRFVIVDRFDVAGGGIIIDDNYPHRTADSLHKSTNIYWTESDLNAEQRTLRNGYPGCVVWLTGLSAAGKSTVSRLLEKRLFALGRHVYVLDGDKVRHGLCKDLGFAPEDRKENIRRVGEVANLFADSGAIVITAFISPYREDRDEVRATVKSAKFIEVYLNAPLAVCEERDPKGLYAKARAGEIEQFTGVSAPYEAPLNPELELRTNELSPEECVAKIMSYIARLK